MVLLRHLRVLALTAALVAVWAIGGAAPAAADYGNSGGNVQLYQVTASGNCNNPDFCGNNLGGFWAWAVMNQDGTFDAEVTGCGHLADAHAPGLQGSQHFQVDGHYIIADLGPGLGLWLVIVDEVQTASGGSLGTGTVITIPSEFMPIGPAAKAKLSTVDFFGFSGPGVSFNVTVTPMHT
jgi:hypothetical protein